MAVRLEGSIKRWIGLSNEDKPAPGQTGFDPALNTSAPIAENDVPAGSSFLETDTGHIYRWNGDQWARSPAEENLLPIMEALLAEVRQLKEMASLWPR